MKICTYGAVSEVHKETLTGAAAVVIDVLRMTSVVSAAVHNGVEKVKLIADESEAREEAKRENALLGGERKGLRLPGFAFGNSPLEYTKENIEGSTLVMTTSNGARAVEAAFGARRIILCSLLNVSHVAGMLSEEENVVIICAGTKDRFSLDDAVCAGALASRLNAEEADDLTIALKHLYEANRENLPSLVQEAKHLKYLKSIGFGADIGYCIREDEFGCAAEIGADGWFYRA